MRHPFGANAPTLTGTVAAVLIAAISGCSDAPTLPAHAALQTPASHAAALRNEPAPPGDLRTISFGGGSLTFWPYTGSSFDEIADPINAVFGGYASPLQIRAALRRLSGNRTPVFPNQYPFNCTWRDAVGDEQTAFAEPEQWTGSAIQLQCGEYSPVRFHVRLFGEGPWTLAGTHMDLHLAGTHQHQSISWDLARELLTFDMARTGLLGASPGLTGAIYTSPQSIPDYIYNAMPASLRDLIGGPPAPVNAPVLIPTDGRARLFTLGTAEPVVPDLSEQDFVIQFNQTIPKPFCGNNEFVRVTGPLHFQSTARVTDDGTYHRVYIVDAELDVQAVNPATGQLGPVQRAKIAEHHEGSITPAGAEARFSTTQRLFSADGGRHQVLSKTLIAGTRAQDAFRTETICAAPR